jgi:hypothetical protein
MSGVYAPGIEGNEEAVSEHCTPALNCGSVTTQFPEEDTTVSVVQQSPVDLEAGDKASLQSAIIVDFDGEDDSSNPRNWSLR